jgi:hypothetical protein
MKVLKREKSKLQKVLAGMMEFGAYFTINIH